MKTFCVLEQGKTVNHEITLKKKEIFLSDESDFYRLNWKTKNDPNAYITKTDIFWSEGRSILYEKVPKKYDYYIFIDEDIVFKCADIVQKISYLLKKYQPISATFNCENIWTMKFMKHQLRFFPALMQKSILEREAFPIKCFDLCAHIFSAEFAEIAFPVIYHGSDRSMHYAQWICSKLYPGKQIVFGKVKIENLENELHSDNIDRINQPKTLVDQFNRETLDGSFDEEDWRIESIGKRNLSHSFMYKASKRRQSISLKDLKKIYNINNSDFVSRRPVRANS